METSTRNYADHLTPRAKQIMDMVISGLKSGEIAKSLGLTVQYVSTVIHAPQFEHQLAIRREKFEETFDKNLIDLEQEASAILVKNASKAAQKMVDLLDNENSTIQQKASGDIMDRVGPTKQATSRDVTQTNIIIDADMAKLIQETMKMDRPATKIIESTEKGKEDLKPKKA